ncbi:hypothetical protein AB9K41_12000, partial [Cribrihabitans sp. XS_ASV171]
MATNFISSLHTFSLDDIVGTFSGVSYPENPSIIDTDGSVVPQFIDKDGNVLSAIDSEFGFYVTDFVGAEGKVLDGDYGEGFAGNIYDETDPTLVTGLSLRNAATDVFKSSGPLGTWSLGIGGSLVKASTEHYSVMAQVLSDQRFPDDPDAIAPLDNDLRLRELRPTGPDGAYEAGLTHNMYVDELTEALQRAIDNVDTSSNPQTYNDLDLDRDGTNDEFQTLSVNIDADIDGDGTPESITVGGVDLDMDGTADLVDGFLNGFGGTADVTDILAPNESTINYDIAYSQDFSVTVKDDGKLLYRFGEAVKRPNDIRMEVNIDLPEEWTADLDSNGISDAHENGGLGFVITRADLVIHHEVTNNPNDQVRPEDYENEAAIGRLPS